MISKSIQMHFGEKYIMLYSDEQRYAMERNVIQ